jgi:hypothetical protein
MESGLCQGEGTGLALIRDRPAPDCAAGERCGRSWEGPGQGHSPVRQFWPRAQQSLPYAMSKAMISNAVLIIIALLLMVVWVLGLGQDSR